MTGPALEGQASLTVQTIIVKLQPRLEGFVTGVDLKPKCRHDWEAHRVHSSQVRFVFSKLDATTLKNAALAGRLIREGVTNCARWSATEEEIHA